jgi:hypothetical protein
MEREAAGEAGDAMTQARIGASAEAARRAMGLEQNRQQAEQYLSGATVGAEQDLASRRLAAQNQALGRRIGAGETAEQMRMRGAEDVAGFRRGVESEAGQANIGTERAIQGQQQQVGQFNVRTGMEGARESEAAAAERARTLAGNRQQTQQYLSGQRYGRGMDINQLRSGRASQIANERLRQQQMARGYFGGAEERANENVNAEANRQSDLYGTQGQLRQGGSRGYLEASNRPRLWEKIANTAIGAVGAATGAGAFTGMRRRQPPMPGARGGMFTEPTVRTIGEQGPEMVSDDYGRSRMVTQPTTALLGNEGPEAVTPMNGRPDNYMRPGVAFGREVVRKRQMPVYT